MSEDKLVLDDGPSEASAQEQNGNAQVQQPAEASPAPAQEKTEREDKVAKGTQFVDFDQIPDKALAAAIENRFRRVYGNVKHLESRFSAAEQERQRMFEVNKQLAEELAALRQAQDGRTAADQSQAIKQQIQNALQVGDYAAATDLTERLAELKAKQSTEAPKKIEVPEPQAPAAPQMDLSPDEQRQLVAWHSAMDESGQPVRPWANPAHPKFRAVLGMISAVTNDPDFENAPLSQILSRVDQMMGGAIPRAQAKATAFPTTDPTVQQKATRAVALSDQEKRVAEMMFHRPGRPGMAKTAEEAHNMYRLNKSNAGNRVTFED